MKKGGQQIKSNRSVVKVKGWNETKRTESQQQQKKIKWVLFDEMTQKKEGKS